MNIYFAEQADADLVQIHRYLAIRNPAAAVALAKLFKAKIENLADFPFISRDRSELGSGLRSIVAQNHVIFYRRSVSMSSWCGCLTAAGTSTRKFSSEQ